MVENLIFNWKKDGQNNGSDILEVSVCGHLGRIYKSLDNNKWTAKIDHNGKRGFHSEEEAKKIVEKEIEKKIMARYEKAQSDLALFKDLGFVFKK